jgi:hypothetical protein
MNKKFYKYILRVVFLIFVFSVVPLFVYFTTTEQFIVNMSMMGQVDVNSMSMLIKLLPILIMFAVVFILYKEYKEPKSHLDKDIFIHSIIRTVVTLFIIITASPFFIANKNIFIPLLFERIIDVSYVWVILLGICICLIFKVIYSHKLVQKFCTFMMWIIVFLFLPDYVAYVANSENGFLLVYKGLQALETSDYRSYITTFIAMYAVLFVVIGLGKNSRNKLSIYLFIYSFMITITAYFYAHIIDENSANIIYIKSAMAIIIMIVTVLFIFNMWVFKELIVNFLATNKNQVIKMKNKKKIIRIKNRR